MVQLLDSNKYGSVKLLYEAETYVSHGILVLSNQKFN